MVADGVPEMEIGLARGLLRSGESCSGEGMVLCKAKTWDCNRGKRYKSSFFHDNNHSSQPVPKPE